MPAASVKTDSNGVLDAKEPLAKIYSSILDRLSKLEKQKVSFITPFTRVLLLFTFIMPVTNKGPMAYH